MPELSGVLGPFFELFLHYMSGGYWHHTNIYVGDGKIIESLPPKVREVNYEIIHTATDVAVYRVKTTDEIKRKAVKFCKDKVGTLFSFRYAYIFPILYPSVSHVEGDRYYCSELVWAAYKSAGIDINGYPGFISPPISGYAVAPQSIADSDNVELITSAGKRKVGC